jgi:hypothetical protein
MVDLVLPRRSTRDLFAEVGTTQHTEIDFDLDNVTAATTDPGPGPGHFRPARRPPIMARIWNLW